MNKIIRNKDNGYSVINNHCLRNKNISEKAKGVFAIIMSLPDDWDFSINGLVSICYGGEGAIRSAIKELIEHGYCERKVIKDPNTKRIIDWEYTFSEKPLCDFPQVGFPDVDFPHLENDTQLNKDIPKTKSNKKLTKKEQYFFDFDSELVSIFKDRPNIEKSVCDWIDFKFDVLKDGYKTINWLKGILECSDYQINEAVRVSISREYKGLFPKSVKDKTTQHTRKLLRLPVQYENLTHMDLGRLLSGFKVEKGVEYMPDITREQFNSLPRDSKAMYEDMLKNGYCNIIE